MGWRGKGGRGGDRTGRAGGDTWGSETEQLQRSRQLQASKASARMTPASPAAGPPPCAPSCPSPLPGAEQGAWGWSAGQLEAARAGAAAGGRCDPRAPSPSAGKCLSRGTPVLPASRRRGGHARAAGATMAAGSRRWGAGRAHHCCLLLCFLGSAIRAAVRRLCVVIRAGASAGRAALQHIGFREEFSLRVARRGRALPPPAPPRCDQLMAATGGGQFSTGHRLVSAIPRAWCCGAECPKARLKCAAECPKRRQRRRPRALLAWGARAV